MPRTHSISDLLTTLAQLGFAVPDDVQDASALTDYAVSARYPGPSEPVVVEDYDTAVATATRVVVWVSRIVEELRDLRRDGLNRDVRYSIRARSTSAAM